MTRTITAALVVLMVLMSTACRAETRIYVSGVPYLCDDAYHQVGCRKDWRTINRQKVRQREPEVRAWQHHEETRNDCRPVISVVGTEHLSEENAKTAAQRAWMDQVRFLHGERFMNLDKSHKLKLACTRSSTGDSATAKLMEKISEGSRLLTRCQIEARPCSVEPEEVGK